MEIRKSAFITPGKGSTRRFAPRGAGAWAALSRSGLLPACKKWRPRRASCWLTLTSFTTRWALVKCGVRNGKCGMQNGLAQPMPWLAYPQGGNRKASGGRLVRPPLRGAFLGLEIGTSQSILPVVVGRFRRTPHIALSGAFLALRASDCNGWPRRWVSGRRRDRDPGSPWKWTHVISTGSGALRQFPRPHRSEERRVGQE